MRTTRQPLQACQHSALRRDQFVRRPFCPIDEHVEKFFLRKCRFFAGTLQLDKLSVLSCDQIKIDRDGFVFFVVEIDDRRSIKHAGTHRGDKFGR